MNTYSKTAALKKARALVGMPIGQGTSWSYYGPYDYRKPAGPSQEGRADSYAKAIARRAKWVSLIALCLMGWEDEDADCSVEDAVDDGCSSILDIIDHCIRHRSHDTREY
jgi:hypothetical protein